MQRPKVWYKQKRQLMCGILVFHPRSTYISALMWVIAGWRFAVDWVTWLGYRVRSIPDHMTWSWLYQDWWCRTWLYQGWWCRFLCRWIEVASKITHIVTIIGLRFVVIVVLVKGMMLKLSNIPVTVLRFIFSSYLCVIGPLTYIIFTT